MKLFLPLVSYTRNLQRSSNVPMFVVLVKKTSNSVGVRFIHGLASVAVYEISTLQQNFSSLTCLFYKTDLLPEHYKEKNSRFY